MEQQRTMDSERDQICLEANELLNKAILAGRVTESQVWYNETNSRFVGKTALSSDDFHVIRDQESGIWVSVRLEDDANANTHTTVNAQVSPTVKGVVFSFEPQDKLDVFSTENCLNALSKARAALRSYLTLG